MASLIKGQILKHLSKFTKNLSPDKINVSTLKGEGELSNLELDEGVLTEILELPSWVKLSKAVCNKVAIKIQWTKLKSQPICLFLDEIMVQMDACENIRDEQNANSPISSYSPQGKYGFAERIIDGMYVSINSVVVNFKADKFAASIQMSRIIVQSRTPTWESGDLRLTRLKDDLRGEILIFKEAEWQTLRIEANALDSGDPNLMTTPLRLIANQSKIRITIKKRLMDCGMVASRLQVNLDDLLWVLTDSQLKAALTFANSLKEVIKKSNQQSKLQAAERLKKQGFIASPVHQAARTKQQQQMTKSQQAISKLFSKYDVAETSYHLYTGRIDLHLCDDMTPDEDNYKRKVEGGAMQVTLHKMCFDYYPFHPAGADRTHWLRYDENMAARDAWAQDLMANFKDDVRKVRVAFTTSQDSSPQTELAPSPTHPHQQATDAHSNFQNQSQGQNLKPQSTSSKYAAAKHTKLLESSMVFRLQDFTLFRVSTANDKRGGVPKKFLSSEKKQLLLPPEMSSVHVEFTDYYFPEGIDFPVPHANMYVVVNPIKLTLDYVTILWMNAFGLNLFRKVEMPQDDGPKFHTDIKLDALMPRIVLPAEPEIHSQSDRPNGLQVQLSRATVTNCRQENKASNEELAQLLDRYSMARLYTYNEFPNEQHDLTPIPDVFMRHVERQDQPYFDKAVEEVLTGGVVNGDLPESAIPSDPMETSMMSQSSSLSSNRKLANQDSVSSMGVTYFSMRTDSFKKNAEKDVWCIAVDQFWLEFIGVPSSKHRPVSFVESFPVTLWLAKPVQSTRESHGFSSNSGSCSSSQSDLSVQEERRKHKKRLLKDYYSPETEENPINSASFNIPNSESDPNDMSNTTMKSTQPNYGDLHALVKIGGKINAQINHYQFLFLMRLIDTVTKYQEELEEDTKLILQKSPPVQKIVLAVSLQEAEVALIGPPIPEIPRALSSEDDIAGDVTDDGTDITSEDPSARDTSHYSQHAHGKEQQYLPNNISYQQHGVELNDSLDSGLVSQGPVNSMQYVDANSLNMDNSPRIYVSDSGTVSMDSSASRLSDNSPVSSSPNHQQNYMGRGKKQPDIKKSFNSAFSSLQRGFGSSYSKITEKMKANMNMDDGIGDDWETVSMKSGSSDDEDYMLLRFQNESEVPAFDRKYVVAVDDDESELEAGADAITINYSGGGDRSRGVVSVVSFRAVNIEAKVQLDDKDVLAAAQIDHLIPLEHGNVNLDKFQAKLAAGGRDPSDTLPPPLSNPPIAVRFQKGPKAEDLAPTAGERGYLRAMVNGFKTQLNISSISILTDLIEDEKTPPIMPMFIVVSDTDVTLKDDKPPTHETSPGPQPIDLHVSRLFITRTEDGVFSMAGDPTPAQIPEQKLVQVPSMDSKFSYSMDNQPYSPKDIVPKDDLRIRALNQENDELKKQIAQLTLGGPSARGATLRGKTLEEYQQENESLTRQLEKIARLSGGGGEVQALQAECDDLRSEAARAKQLQAENDQLFAQLTTEQDRVVALKEERERLLATIQFMQEELEVSEHNRNHERSRRSRHPPPPN